MVLKKDKTKNNIDIVLWDFEYNNKLFYSIATYPTATQTLYNKLGIIRNEKFCLMLDFKTLEETKKAFEELKNGTKNIIDFKKNFHDISIMEALI